MRGTTADRLTVNRTLLHWLRGGIDVVSRAQFKITDLEFEIRCCEEP